MANVKKKLNEKQEKALALLTSGRGMSYTQIAEEVDINRKTLWRWMHEPQFASFQERWKELNDEKWMATVEAAREAALKLCLEGKTEMVKFVLQNAGYNPTQKVEADVDVKSQVVIIDDIVDDYGNTAE